MQMYRLDNNNSRADMFVSFINGVDWKDEVAQLDRLSKVANSRLSSLPIVFRR